VRLLSGSSKSANRDDGRKSFTLFYENGQKKFEENYKNGNNEVPEFNWLCELITKRYLS